MPGGRRACHSLLAMLALACQPASTSRRSSKHASSPSPSRPSMVDSTCPGGEVLAWAPVDTKVLVHVDLRDDTLAHALTRSSTLDSGVAPVPILVAAIVAELHWELRTIRFILANAGFYPNKIVRLTALDGTTVWLWHGECDFPVARHAIETAWHLDMIETSAGWRGHNSATKHAFPYDALVLPGGRFALVPAGTAARMHGWLMAAPPPAPSRPPAELLGLVPAAPIRAVWSGDALLGSHVADDQVRVEPVSRWLRVTPSDIEIGGTLWQPLQQPRDDGTNRPEHQAP